MEALPQALEIILEVQMARNNEKITRKKISFPTYKTLFFFFFFSLDSSYFSNLIIFLFNLNDLNAIKISPEVLQIICEL
jgi:hypothetical protein